MTDISYISVGDILSPYSMLGDVVIVKSIKGEKAAVRVRYRFKGLEPKYHISVRYLAPKKIDGQTLEGFGLRASRNPRQWTMDYGDGGIMRVTETETGWEAEFVDSENCASVRTEHVHELQHLARIIAGVNLTLNP